jgi:hypothetical protein
LERREESGIGGGETNPDLGFSPLHATTTETSDRDERQPLSLGVGPAQIWAQAS